MCSPSTASSLEIYMSVRNIYVYIRKLPTYINLLGDIILILVYATQYANALLGHIHPVMQFHTITVQLMTIFRVLRL